MTNSIPKIIHQLWIGDKPAPIKLMNTWKEKHPDFEYIFWNEEEISKRSMIFECQNRIDEIEEINGKADIMRWEILYKYGGVFIDADSFCIENITQLINVKYFAGYENEICRKGLLATGTMGFPANNSLVLECINYIKNNPVSNKETGNRAWKTVGPLLLTNVYNTGKYNDMTIYPSYYFLPIHHSGLEYKGHGKVYAFQQWGSSFKISDLNTCNIPYQLINKPSTNISLLIPSYNTKSKYIQECIASIISQEGYFNIEVVWINDGSNILHTTILERHLDYLKNNSRFIDIIYHKNDVNMGLGYSLNKGVNICSHEIIMRHDSDDIMLNNRIQLQLEYMINNPNTHILGGQVVFFDSNTNNKTGATTHPSITWEQYKKLKSHWIANHPTLCFRKNSIIKAGNYDINKTIMCEDLDLELRMIKLFGKLDNLPNQLINYRIHNEQVTKDGGKEGLEYWNNIRNNYIEQIINS
jgi:GT2 family glycosyltransferase